MALKGQRMSESTLSALVHSVTRPSSHALLFIPSFSVQEHSEDGVTRAETATPTDRIGSHKDTRAVSFFQEKKDPNDFK